MYQLIGISSFLKGYAVLTAVLTVGLITNFWGYVPGLQQLPMNQISTAVLLVTAVVGLLGSSPVFPLMCRLPFLWQLFPCIDGDYIVEVSSNWSLISQRNQGDRNLPADKSDGESLFKKTGKATIKARLLSVQIQFETDDGYSLSNTVVCSATPGTEGARPSLYYIYQNLTPVPEASDSERHFGAARITIPSEKCPSVLNGTYWTDRNWHRGLNTAGRIRLTRSR